MKDKSEAPCLFVYEDDDTELIPSLQSVVSRQRQLADRVIVKTAKTIKRERTVNPARVTATRPTKIRWQSVKSGVAMRSRGAVRPRPATKAIVVAIPTAKAYSLRALFWIILGLIAVLGFSVEYRLKITAGEPTTATYHWHETSLSNLFRSAER